MLGWNIVKNFTIDSPPTYALGRLPEVEERYTRHRNQIMSSEYYSSIADYILKDVIRDYNFVFTENEFPYKVDEGIKHYLLWVSPTSAVSVNVLETIASQPEIKRSKEYTYYRNYKNNASIYEIEHYHIFAKY